MTWERIGEGFVSERQPDTPTAVAAGSRCAVTPDGSVVSTYMVQSALGINDFVPTLSRSTDGGASWVEEGPIWPHLQGRYSLFVSVSRSPGGDLFLYGSQTPIDEPGESFWNEATQGMKQNELVWAKSTDGGRSWTEPHTIPVPIPGAAEAPGALCITRSGRWLGCYAPYNDLEASLEVDRGQIVLVRSDDEGKSWEHTAMLRFAQPDSSGAEAWVVELADGRLLGTSWHMNLRGGDYPCAYALSENGGETWSPTRSTEIQGQTTALAPLSDGRALFLYCQRKEGEVGIGMARVHPSEEDFGVERREIIWRADTVTQSQSGADHAQWQDFAFGEPSATLLGDHTVLVTFWCVQPAGRGVRYVRLRMAE